MVGDVLIILVVVLSLIGGFMLLASDRGKTGPRCWLCAYRTSDDDLVWLNDLPTHDDCAFRYCRNRGLV